MLSRSALKGQARDLDTLWGSRAVKLLLPKRNPAELSGELRLQDALRELTNNLSGVFVCVCVTNEPGHSGV